MCKAILTVNDRQIPVSPLDVIRIVAYNNGYDDIDYDPALYTVTASKRGGEITVKAKTLEELCDKFCLRVLSA